MIFFYTCSKLEMFLRSLCSRRGHWKAV